MRFIALITLFILGLSYQLYGLATKIEKQMLNLNTNHPIQILQDGWVIKQDARILAEKQSIPIYFSDDINLVEFSHSFKMSEQFSDHLLRIWFIGLDGYAEIYLNGVLLKEHPYFSNSFCVDIPEEKVKQKENNMLTITLRRAQFRHEKLSQMAFIFREKDRFGIGEAIALEWIPPLHFSLQHFSYQNDSLIYHYTFSSRVEEEKRIARKALIKIDEEVIKPDGDVVFSRYQYIPVNPEPTPFSRAIKLPGQFLWSPDSPDMYRLRLQARITKEIIREDEFKLGLRSIKIREGNFYLNNKRLQIQGVTYHQNYSGKRREQIKNDLMTIKQMGFNAIRCPHYVPHPYVFNLADSLGILLFIENGLWRLPEIYYKDNLFIQNTKLIVSEILDRIKHNPSVLAIGLGHEIPIDLPESNKFIFILNEQFKTHPTVLSYISPLHPGNISGRAITDFYLINKYGKAVFTLLYQSSYQTILPTALPFLLGNVGFIRSAQDLDQYPYEFLTYFFTLYASHESFDGFFIESYRDWESAIPGPFTERFEGKAIYPQGIFDLYNRPKPIARQIPDLLNQKFYKKSSLKIYDNDSNFFSILAFISSIIFFLIYKRNFRFKENLSRSLVHPYGFFVDLRDRRIISTMNSTILGVFASLQMANFVGAYFYLYHNNLRIQEYLVTIFSMLKLNVSFITFTHKAWQIVLFLFILFYLLHLFIAFLIKFAAYFHKEHIRFRQGLAVSNWSGSPAVFFIPLSLFGYYLFQQEMMVDFLWIVFLLFFIWYNFRLANGIRVLFIYKTLKIITIMILTYTLIIVSLIFYTDNQVEMYEYLRLLGDASHLFL